MAGIKLYNRSAFTITSGQCCPVSVHDHNWTCVPSVFTIKAHVYGGCSRSKHDMCTVGVHDQSTTCVWWVFTIKAHVYRQCSRSKLDMVPAPVHEGKSTQISSYSVPNVSTSTLSVKVHYQTFLQARAVNVHSKAGHVHSLAILIVTNADEGNRNHKPRRQC